MAHFKLKRGADPTGAGPDLIPFCSRCGKRQANVHDEDRCYCWECWSEMSGDQTEERSIEPQRVRRPRPAESPSPPGYPKDW